MSEKRRIIETSYARDNGKVHYVCEVKRSLFSDWRYETIFFTLEEAREWKRTGLPRRDKQKEEEAWKIVHSVEIE